VQGTCPTWPGTWVWPRPLLGLYRESGEDLGASLAVNIDGEMVVDLWGGWADEARTVPWAEDTLLQLAAVGGGAGAVVEIGSYLGRSTAFLAAGSKGAGREKVVAVDHFRGSPEHQAGQAFASPTLAREGTTFHGFQDNLRRLDLGDYVTPIVASSAEAAGQWHGPIRLLFIDGDHSYEESRRDFELWSPFVVPHGVVCFHDIRNWPGVTRFYEELLRGTTAYREVVAVLTLRVIEKLRPP
jgi:predicted O-methyltransferase YrrM